mmetsp:Transcript_18577/g.43032  ORF Transcript_18577/g.43032 Transcript_18577/m.43032 type:complete len:191 (-) Transcript_18577:340-912(-)|eukprot:CAMPEP_0116843182 /NCGR_PEP_ID=MMETSP0418-20121206/11942_1 /TAXON_ID=1158023 /ORGANISM="Astrosyne radiata, Strain 13vi08-1A" /LENGTH=190 /DNA_ID=CAMNT_0004473899 /DNA_START=50 /DNA_END=622 /DNA_ORIENTATION=-
MDQQQEQQQFEEQFNLPQQFVTMVPSDVPAVINLAHKIDDDLESISDCSSCRSHDDDNDDMEDIQPIAMDSDDWRISPEEDDKPTSLERQTSLFSLVVPTIISLEDGDQDGCVETFAFPATGLEDELPSLVVSENELDMDDRSIATFSLVDEEDQRDSDFGLEDGDFQTNYGKNDSTSFERFAHQWAMAC